MLAVGDIFTVINIAMQNQILAVVINSAYFSYFLSFPSSSLKKLFKQQNYRYRQEILDVEHVY